MDTVSIHRPFTQTDPTRGQKIPTVIHIIQFMFSDQVELNLKSIRKRYVEPYPHPPTNVWKQITHVSQKK